MQTVTTTQLNTTKCLSEDLSKILLNHKAKPLKNDTPKMDIYQYRNGVSPLVIAYIRGRPL